MAKDLVRTRRYVRKFVLMRANIQAVSLKIQTLKSNNSMAQAMKGVTKAMGTMNRQVCPSQSTFPSPLTFRQVTHPPCFFQLKLPQIQKIMMEFERQAEIMDMKEEMMNDAIDDAMGDEEDEEERCGTLTGRQEYLPGPLTIHRPDEFFLFLVMLLCPRYWMSWD